MVNSRLSWYLERHIIITEYQSGFRRSRSTVDNLVTLETLIRDAFVCRKHLVSIFFDLEKAYDTTWKHGILLDLYKTGLRVRLSMLSVIFYLIVVLQFVSGIYTVIFTHRRQVSHRVVLFRSRYLVSRLIVLYLVYCLILNVPFMQMIQPFITVLVICHLSRESYNILSTDQVDGVMRMLLSFHQLKLCVSIFVNSGNCIQILNYI